MASFKKIRRAIRRPFEAFFFKLFALLVPCLPRCAVVGLARATGWIASHLPLRGRRISRINIDAVFGDTLSPAEKARIVRTSFTTMTQTLLDVVWFSRFSARRIRKYVAFEEGPNYDALLEDRAAICVTAHIGNWEVMGQAIALRGARMASIAATIKNPAVDQMFVAMRERTGQQIIPQKGALRSLVARLRKKGKVAFVLDQNTPEKEGGVPVEFLGFPTPVSLAPAALAYRTGTEIFLGFCLPEPGGHYRVHIPETIAPPPFDKERDAREAAVELTRHIQDGISREIRRHPEYWLWSYRHWRRKPGKSYPPGYPTY